MIDDIFIPFLIEDVYNGFANCQGIIRVENSNIVLEFQTKDNFIGLIKSDLKMIVIKAADIASIELEKKFFKLNLLIKSRTLQTFKNFPGVEQGRLVLKLAKKEEPDARELVSAIKLMISEEKLRKAEN